MGTHISLEGMRNTRDLGGMITRNGYRTKEKKLIRSGRLSHATERDVLTLKNDYKLRCVIDLRTKEECEHAPNPHSSFLEVRFVSIPILNSNMLGITRETLDNVIEAAHIVAENPVGMMSSLYPQMLLDNESQKGFAAFFDELLSHEEGSMLWHCTIGKDRAGLATVLLLTVLDVEPETITQDYLLTNRYMQSSTQEILSALASYGITDELRSSIQILNSVDTRFLQAGFDAVDAAYGSLNRYIKEALNVTDDKAEALREKYLEAV